MLSCARSLLSANRHNFLFQTERTLKKEIRKKLKEKTSTRKLALEYFDFFYGASYGAEWNEARLAMLTGSKYAALVNNYASRNETIKLLGQLAAVDFFEFARREKSLNLKQVVDDRREPPMLKVFSFPTGDTSLFPPPKFTENRLMNYYCMDAASILPVLALDIQKDDSVLDLCSSPGGKTLVMLQTMLPKRITCKDATPGRLERLRRMLRTYLAEEELNELVKIELNYPMSQPDEFFDKVLVDVPCSNDRHSLFEENNNIFSKQRTEERTELPKKQAALLKQAIESCRVNGTIVYSTCSLSPIQNEGVVNQVVSAMQESAADFRLRVEPLESLKRDLSYFFSFSDACKLGLLVLPQICKNFGPFYLCKIRKMPK